MKTKLLILLAALAFGGAATNANAADSGTKPIYNGKGQLIAVVRTDVKPKHDRAAVASTGYCSTCCPKKSR